MTAIKIKVGTYIQFKRWALESGYKCLAVGIERKLIKVQLHKI